MWVRVAGNRLVGRWFGGWLVSWTVVLVGGWQEGGGCMLGGCWVGSWRWVCGQVGGWCAVRWVGAWLVGVGRRAVDGERVVGRCWFACVEGFGRVDGGVFGGDG